MKILWTLLTAFNPCCELLVGNHEIVAAGQWSLRVIMVFFVVFFSPKIRAISFVYSAHIN